MSAIAIVTNPAARDWRATVAGQLLPSLHGHLSKALADCSYALALAGDCRSGPLATAVPTRARPASSRRRYERLLANGRLDPDAAQGQLAAAVLAAWAWAKVVLVLDETPKANDLRALCVRVCYRGRALPLVWACYALGEPPMPMPDLVRALLERARQQLPDGAEVVLLADRGLAWPVLVDWCTAHGWHYLVRLQGQTHVRRPQGGECTARELVGRRGRTWWGEAEVFKKAGWRGANVVAVWRRDCAEPWLLLTDQRASLRHCGVYARRMWVEESFRDDKSSGFDWGRSQVLDPAHAGRLLLVMALAMVLAASLGSAGSKWGWRHALEVRAGRLSVVQWGLRWLRYALEHGSYERLRLGRLYLYPK